MRVIVPVAASEKLPYRVRGSLKFPERPAAKGSCLAASGGVGVDGCGAVRVVGGSVVFLWFSYMFSIIPVGKVWFY